MVLLTGKGEEMLYPYIELPDETIVTHSEIKPDNTVLMKNARKSPYFNAGMDRAYCL